MTFLSAMQFVLSRWVATLSFGLSLFLVFVFFYVGMLYQ
jgi:hypothetical protein